jgi:hypothetical protein
MNTGDPASMGRPEIEDADPIFSVIDGLPEVRPQSDELYFVQVADKQRVLQGISVGQGDPVDAA